MTARGDWEERFGARRRALDRAILKEAERQIGLEASEKPADGHISFAGPSVREEREEARRAISRAFGRPLN